ncbi:mRNA-decapping enzyme subunit 2 [Lobosporangium transversale]|nr:mRNA-decapping enzyme subunit 2 [Lobosporangium transversale]
MAWATATFDNVLDDLSSRFIINVPDEELASVERICFQIEQAHWFYEDFVREQNPSLPSFNLKNFSAKFFQHCPLLHEWSNEHETAFANFMEYKIRVPVCGAIILNEAMDKVWEETGFDLTDKINDNDYVEQTIKDQRIRLYIVKGVPESTVFEPQTRKEISKIEWHSIADLPTSKPKPVEKGTQSGKESGTERASGAKSASRYYMVTPFVHKLKIWINQQRRNSKRNNGYRGQNPQGTSQQQHTHVSENHATSISRHQQHQHSPHQAAGAAASAAPVVTPTEARLDSDILKSMLGIGKSPSSSTPSHDQSQNQNQNQQHPQYQYQHPVHHNGPVQDHRNSSDSLKALLGIQSPVNNPNMFLRDGMAMGSPTIQSTSTTHPMRPLSTPSMSSSSVPYQNGSDALKAMLGIPSQPNSPLLRFAAGDAPSPVAPQHTGAIPNGHYHGLQQQQQRPDFSPRMHYQPAVTGSPTFSRNSPVDLLALLKNGTGAVGSGGGGGGEGGGAGTEGSNGGYHAFNQSNGNGQNHGHDFNGYKANSNGGSHNPHSNNNSSGVSMGDHGVPAAVKAPKTTSMQNFSFDVDAMF